MKNIGPKMQEVIDYVSSSPGCVTIEVARHVGPNGSLRYGYRTVGRALAAGLIRRESGARNSYRLFPVGGE